MIKCIIMTQAIVNVISQYSLSEIFEFLKKYGNCVNYRSENEKITSSKIFVGSISEVGNKIVRKLKYHIWHILVLIATNLVGTDDVDDYSVRIVLIGKAVEALVQVNIKKNDVIAVLNPIFFYVESKTSILPSLTIGPNNVILWLCRHLKVQMGRATLAEVTIESEISELGSESNTVSSTNANTDYRLVPVNLKEIDTNISVLLQDTQSVSTSNSFIFHQRQNTLNMKSFQNQETLLKGNNLQSHTSLYTSNQKKNITSNLLKPSHTCSCRPQKIHGRNIQSKEIHAINTTSVTQNKTPLWAVKKSTQIKNNKVQKFDKTPSNNKNSPSQNTALPGSSHEPEGSQHLQMPYNIECSRYPGTNLNSGHKSNKISANVGCANPKKSIPNTTHQCSMSYQTNCLFRSCFCQHFHSCIGETTCLNQRFCWGQGNTCGSCFHGCLCSQHNAHFSCQNPNHTSSHPNQVASPSKSCFDSSYQPPRFSCSHMNPCCSPHSSPCFPYRSCCTNLRNNTPLRYSCCTANPHSCCSCNCTRSKKIETEEDNEKPVPCKSPDLEKVNRTANWVIQHNSLDAQPARSICSLSSSELSSYTPQRVTYTKSNKSKDKVENVPHEPEAIKKKRKLFNPLETNILAEESLTSVIEESTPFYSEQSTEQPLKRPCVPIEHSKQHKDKKKKNYTSQNKEIIEKPCNTFFCRNKDSNLGKSRKSGDVRISEEILNHSKKPLGGDDMGNPKLRTETKKSNKASGSVSSSSQQSPIVVGHNSESQLYKLQGNNDSNAKNPDPLLSEEIELLSEAVLKKRKNKSSVSTDSRSRESSKSNKTIELE